MGPIGKKLEFTFRVSCDVLVSESTASSLANWALLDAGDLLLKGKSGRTKLFAVVGDELVASSAKFVELRLAHELLLQALRSRSVGSRKLVGAAKLKTTGVFGGLEEFYRRISRRQDHFLAASTEKDVSYAEVGQ